MFRKSFFLYLLVYMVCNTMSGFAQKNTINDDRFVSYVVDPQKQDLKLYWKNEQDEIYRSIGKLKQALAQQRKTLVFAMNGGMYMEDNSPLGLFIDNYKIRQKLNSKNANGNFYLKPNGVFFINADHSAGICTTPEYTPSKKVQYATQSGPMLVIDGHIHPAFKEGSENLNIRNGVGILPGNKIIFVISKKEINFYEFALYFKKLGCNNALYLDGYVSRMYLPEQKWTQIDGNFGVIIGVTVPAK